MSGERKCQIQMRFTVEAARFLGRTPDLPPPSLLGILSDRINIIRTEALRFMEETGSALWARCVRILSAGTEA
jgi:hypothetical protein